MKQRGLSVVASIFIIALLGIGLVVLFWPGYPPNQFLQRLLSKKSPQQQITNPQQTTQTNTSDTLQTHQMPKLLDIEVKSGVDKNDETEMRKGFKIIDFYLNEWLGHSITRKSAIRVEATSGDSKNLEENGTFVFLYRTLSRDWQLPKQFGMQSRAAAHEYVHLYQMNNGCARPGREGEKARWFLEGEAEWLSYKAFEESGASFFFGWKKQLLVSGADLRPLQTYDDERPGSENDTYPYFTSAVDFLMKNRDIKTLDDFCVNLGKKQEVSVAFQNAFGVSFEQFRSDFEAYFTKTFSKQVKEGGGAPPSGDKESQIPQGYSSWADFCKVQPKDSRCAANKP